MTEQQHCGHECVCIMYIGRDDWLQRKPCNYKCDPSHDTRSCPHTPAPAATFSEEECEYLEELILDNIEQYPDSGSFTPEKRDALYQKIAFKMQAGDGDES